MPEDDDALLVRRCLQGDQRAFELLVNRYQGPVFNTALRMVHDHDDAQDVAQTAFLKAYERLGTYDGERKFFSWLYRIAVNEALNFLDRKRHYEPLDETAPLADDTATEERRDAERILERGLQELNPEQRAVIVLKHLQGLSYSEIGQILAISEKKVKSRLFSARMRLRGILSAKGMDRQ